MNHEIDSLERHLSDAEVVALLEGRASADARGHLLLCDVCRNLYETSGAVLAEDLAATTTRRRGTPRRRWAAVTSGVAAAAIVAFALVTSRPDPSVDLRDALPSELWPAAERITGQWMVVPGFEEVAARQIPLRRSADRDAPDFVGHVEQELDRMEAGEAEVEDFVRGIMGLLGDGEFSSARAWAVRAAATFDTDPRIGFLDALTAQCVGDFDAAVQRLQLQCDQGRGDPTLCADLVIVLAQLGRVDDARRTLTWLEGSGASAAVLERGRTVAGVVER